MCSCVFFCMYVFLCMFFSCVYVCVCTCMCICVRACMCSYVRACICVCVCMCARTCVYVCVYVYKQSYRDRLLGNDVVITIDEVSSQVKRSKEAEILRSSMQKHSDRLKKSTRHFPGLIDVSNIKIFSGICGLYQVQGKGKGNEKLENH